VVFLHSLRDLLPELGTCLMKTRVLEYAFAMMLYISEEKVEPVETRRMTIHDSP
jgi:hypothetical protein